MTKLRTLASALAIGLAVGSYTSSLYAEETEGSKFADPYRLYETFMADDEAQFADDLVALDDSYTQENIDEVLSGLDHQIGDLEGERDAAQGLLDEVTEAEGALETSFTEDIPVEISGYQAGDDLAATSEATLMTIEDLLLLDTVPVPPETVSEYEQAIIDLGLDPVDVTQETLDGWQATLEMQTGALEAAAAAADGAQDEVDRLTGEIEALEGEKGEIAEVTDAFYAKRDAIIAAIELLSPEEVFALNRSLNNALNNGLLEGMQEYDLEILRLAEDMSKQQINALTKAFEEEAKFTKLSEKFTEGSKQQEHMLAKAESHKDRFLSKAGIDMGDTVTEAAKGAAKGAARDATKDAAKDAAKLAAKDSAKGAAKDAAKLAAKDAAKGAAKDAAKLAAKDAAKGAAKDAAKLAAKDAAKSAAKDAAKDAAKSAAKDAAKLAAKDAAKDAAKQAAKQAAKDAAKQAAKQAAKDAAKRHGKA